MLLLYVYLYIGTNKEMEVNSFFRNLLLDNYLIKDYGRHRRIIFFWLGGPSEPQGDTGGCSPRKCFKSGVPEMNLLHSGGRF